MQLVLVQSCVLKNIAINTSLERLSSLPFISDYFSFYVYIYIIVSRVAVFLDFDLTYLMDFREKGTFRRAENDGTTAAESAGGANQFAGVTKKGVGGQRRQRGYS
jgi:hypothetical protein